VASKDLLRRAGVPFSDFVYHGVIAINSSFFEGEHSFDFVLLCEYTGSGFVVRSSLAVPALFCQFYPFYQILEAIQDQPIEKILIQWRNNAPNQLPTTAIKPHEDFQWNGRTLDLKVFIIVQNTDATQILMVEDERGKLMLPGGRFGQNENLVKTCIRQTKEQTGFDIIPTKLTEIVYGWADYSPLHFLVVSQIESGELKTEPDEHSQSAKWFTLEEFQADLNNRRLPQFQKVWDLRPYIANYVQNLQTQKFVQLY